MLRWVENFTGFGTGATGRTNMLQGIWAEIASGLGPSTSIVRGNGTHAFHSVGVTSSPVGNPALRRVYGGDFTEFGHGAAFYLSQLPAGNTEAYLFQCRDSANAPQFTIGIGTTGTIRVESGDHGGTLLAETSAPALVAGAYQHVEFKVDMNAGSPTGRIEIRVNEVEVLDVSGLDLQATAITGCAQVDVARVDSPGATQIEVMDLSFWDQTGSVNNDFLGDVQWLTVLPNGDTSATAWTRNTGSNDFEAIDDSTPDGDTTYVEGTASGQVSAYELGALPALASEVVAVVSRVMARKTDAGSGSLQVGVISTLGSPDVEDNGADRPMTEVYTYYDDVCEVDPATGVAWTPTAVNAAQLSLDRTA